MTAWAILTAALALISSVIALAFQLFPSLKPDPRERLGADASVFALDPDVTYEAYLKRTSFSQKELNERRRRAIQLAGGSKGVLDLPGVMAYVETTVEGFKRREVTLRWSIYDAETRQPYSNSWDPALKPGGEQELIDSPIDLAAPSDEAVEMIWIPEPKRGRKYFIRIGIYDEGNVLLALTQSRKFTSG
jgi:hypothetical protein